MKIEADRIALILNSSPGASTGVARLVERMERREQVCIVVPPDPMSAEMRERGHAVEDWKLNRKPRLLLVEVIAASIRLAKILKRRSVEIAHSFGHLSNLCTFLACCAARTPVVLLSITGLGSAFLERRRLLQFGIDSFYWLAVRAGARVTCENSADLRRFSFLGRRGPTRLVAAGVDTDRFRNPERDHAWQQKRTALQLGSGPTVIFVGRLIAHKGIRELLQAWAGLTKRYPTAHLLILGSADPGSRYALDASEFSEARNVHCLGYRDDVVEVLALADIFVNPSYREGMPRTNMEALAIGKPIVTTDVPGCAETVEDGINGFLVPSADAKALEAALDRLLSNPSLREAMGRASLEKARRDFSIQQMVSRLQQAHQDAWLEHTQACREHHPAGSTPMRAQHPPRSLKEGCTTAKPGELQIQPLDASSLGRVVEIHRQAFPAFFLTALGPGFLRCLYEEISHDAKGIALCCTHSGEIVGFVAGTSQPSGFYRRLLWRRWWRFAFAGLGTVLKRPHYVPRILNAFHKPAEALRAEAQRGECYAELMSIGVCPEAQGTGVGKFLVNAFLSECWRRGLDRVSLTTDSMGNDSANQFYLRNGFALTRTFSTAQGRVMNEYEIWVTRRDGVIRREASIVL